MVRACRGDFRAAELAQMRGQAALLSAGNSYMPSFIPVENLAQAFDAAQGKGGATLRLDDSEHRIASEKLNFSGLLLPQPILRPLLGALVAGLGITLYGRPGAGALLLARRLDSLLPEITNAELRTIRRLYNDGGMPAPHDRPFRAPHHTASIAALIGGTSPGLSIERPGELHLAQHGVLLLDELLEYIPPTLRAFSEARPKHTLLPVAIVRPGEHRGAYARTEPFRSQIFPVVVPISELRFEGKRTSSAEAREIIAAARARTAPLAEEVLATLPQGGNVLAERSIVLATALAKLDGAEHTTQKHIDEARGYLAPPTGTEAQEHNAP
jgi:hypothetical protein